MNFIFYIFTFFLIVLVFVCVFLSLSLSIPHTLATEWNEFTPKLAVQTCNFDFITYRFHSITTRNSTHIHKSIIAAKYDQINHFQFVIVRLYVYLGISVTYANGALHAHVYPQLPLSLLRKIFNNKVTRIGTQMPQVHGTAQCIHGMQLQWYILLF